MSRRRVEDTEPISDKTLINKNRALEDEIKNLRARLEEAEELQRAISEGDLDALVIPRPEGELVFTLNSADYAYRVLVETMNEGTVTLGFDGTILYCNRRFAELLRMHPQDIVSKSIYQFIVPEDLAIFRALLERKKNSGEVKLHATGGKSIPVYLSISSMQAEDSQNAWCIVVTDLTNITEHMKNEELLKKAYEEIQVKNEELHVQSEELQVANEALAESEEQYRMLFRNMTEGFGLLQIIYNSDGRPYDYRYLEINPAFELCLGVNKEQMLGRTMREVFPNVNPIAIEKYGEVALSNQPIDFEIYSEIANRPLDIHAFIPEEGKIALILRDISKRKEAEAKLKDTLDNLNKLVKERTAKLEKEESNLQRKNHILEGINRILSHVVQAKTEEEIGNVCLSVGLDITGSQIGFVGEVGSDGLLHDIAISDMGWNQCKMYDKTGHRRPPGDFILHGLYGSIIDSGKGFFTNYPLSHPDSIGLPSGHPSLTSFLGVPLIKGEKVVGMLSVANREGGYSSEQQEDLEAIAQTVAQVLQRKREEQERKTAEEALAKIEIARKKEIHHRIKNNLQVISSLLDLQAEHFRDKECINDSEILEAFRESQNRVISMALIHEELYKGGGFETLNFSPYIQELTESLFQTYRLGNADISLKLDLVENTFFDMDLAVPLGMIVNELVTNSLKHAFKGKEEGEIKIKLSGGGKTGEYMDSIEECKTEDCNSNAYVLSISDNGIGIPEDIEIEELDSLGVQLVITLVDQLDGELELKRNNGTEFTVRFTVIENNNSTKERLPTSIG